MSVRMSLLYVYTHASFTCMHAYIHTHIQTKFANPWPRATIRQAFDPGRAKFTSPPGQANFVENVQSPQAPSRDQKKNRAHSRCAYRQPGRVMPNASRSQDGVSLWRLPTPMNISKFLDINKYRIFIEIPRPEQTLAQPLAQAVAP